MIDRTQFTFYESFYKAISRIKNDSDRAITNVEKIVNERVLRGKNTDLDVIIISKGKAVKVLRYKKKNLTPAK